MRLEMQYSRAFVKSHAAVLVIGRQQAASAAAASGKSLPPAGGHPGEGIRPISIKESLCQ
jgi:hypothetical protein